MGGSQRQPGTGDRRARARASDARHPVRLAPESPAATDGWHGGSSLGVGRWFGNIGVDVSAADRDERRIVAETVFPLYEMS